MWSMCTFSRGMYIICKYLQNPLLHTGLTHNVQPSLIKYFLGGHPWKISDTIISLAFHTGCYQAFTL